MKVNSSTNENLSLQKRIEMSESNVPAEEQTVAANLDDPAGLLRSVAEESADDTLDRRLSPRTDSRGSEWKYDWSRDPSMEPGRRHGETLAGQERRLGREREQTRHGEVARAAYKADQDRAKSTRMVVEEHSWHRYPVAETEVDVMPLEWATEAELTGTVDENVAARIRDQASRIRERVDGAPSVGLLRRWMVERVRRGQDLIAAVDDVHREAQRWNGATQSIGTIRWGDETATVEVEIATLWDPKASSQKQVGILRDDEGATAKFVIWQNSMKRCTLREGDRVKFEEIKVNVWDGDLALAVTSDTTVRILEEGDGPSKFRTKGTEWDPDDGRDHEWVNGVPERHIEANTGFERNSDDDDDDPEGDEMAIRCPADDCEFRASPVAVHRHVAEKASQGDVAHSEVDFRVMAVSMVMDHQFEVTHSQEEVPEKTIEEDDSDEWWPLGFENAGQDCPKCGSSSTRGCQQQTGSADEAMTGFHKCGDCGHDWRSGYGA